MFGTPIEADGALETFFWNSSDLMLVIDAELKVVRANPTFSRVTGLKAGTLVLELVAPAEQTRVRDTLMACLKGGTRQLTTALVGGTAGRRLGEWSVCAEPSVRQLYVVIRDVTMRDRLEKELAQAQKLEAVGTLASGIAHEINTPIQFIGDNLTFIRDSLGELLKVIAAVGEHEPSKPVLEQFKSADLPFLTAELPAAIEQASEGVQRVSELVRGMKEFAHQDGGQVVPTNLNTTLERTIAVARNEWKYAAELETDFQNVPPVPCLASAIRQVFLNLICNAAHANADRNAKTGRGRGLIKISTRSEGDVVVVAISDSGTGIDEAVRARVFEPFFTTKPVGQGTGQGLAISRAIVCDKHGGELTFETEVGVGTTFFVRLPLRSRVLEAA